jgi:hypothetical protein
MSKMKNVAKLMQLCKQVAKSPEWRHPQRIQDEIEQLKSRVEKLEHTPVVYASAQPSDTEQARPF